jgi:RNA polymerase sigma-70 factor (ECF subfamily)
MMTENNSINTAAELARLMSEAKNTSEGFNRLCEACLTPVYRYILLRVRHKETAEDLTQTVFLKAYNSIGKFKEIGKSPLAWFFTIARNSIIDHFRSTGKVQIESDEILAFIPIKNDYAAELDKERDMGVVKKLIVELSPDQQEVLVLKFINDLTNKEISEVLGKSEESIRQLQSRGLKTLKKLTQEIKN